MSDNFRLSWQIRFTSIILHYYLFSILWKKTKGTIIKLNHIWRPRIYVVNMHCLYIFSNKYVETIFVRYRPLEFDFAARMLIQYIIISTQFCRIKGCGGAGCPPPPPPPPIIFERLKLPQQIIYRRKENLSESPNHQKYWENILVSRFYEQFSRNRRNLGHFRKFEKISNS